MTGDEILDAMEARNRSFEDGTWLDRWHDFCVSQMEKYLKAAGFFLRPDLLLGLRDQSVADGAAAYFCRIVGRQRYG